MHGDQCAGSRPHDSVRSRRGWLEDGTVRDGGRVIYDQPVLRSLGDCYIGVEFGDEADLALSFRVLALHEVLSSSEIPGLVELQPSLRQLAILIDRRRISYVEVCRIVEEALPRAYAIHNLPSRLLRLPMWYNDPWSAETARRFGVRNNMEVVAAHNELSVDEVIAHHTGTDHWLTAVGFSPGSSVHYALDPRRALTAPKYERPRSYTPARCVGLGGRATAHHPVASPGGYQLIGRLAVNTYENFYEQGHRNSAFGDDGVLLCAGDRIRYWSVDALTYEEIREEARLGRYEYEVEEGFFDIQAYLKERHEFSVTKVGE